MSPTSSASAIYDHLLIDFHQQPKLFSRHGSDSANCNQFVSTTLRKSIPPDEHAPITRHYTITHIPVSEPIVRCSVSNQVYDKGLLRKSPLPAAVPDNSFQASRSSTAKTSRVQLSTPTFEDSPTDFRPLIINGRRRFTTLPSSSPMIIIKKKSPSPMHGISLKEVDLLKYPFGRDACLHWFSLYNCRNRCFVLFLSIQLAAIQQSLLVLWYHRHYRILLLVLLRRHRRLQLILVAFLYQSKW